MSDLRRGDDRADGLEVGEVDAVVTQPLVPLPALPADRLLVCATERYDEVLGQDQMCHRSRAPAPVA